jgi:chorismate mutase/prephenate dehydratase
VPVGSNAEGARRARDEDGTAAIARAAAAEVYGLNLLVPQIEDRPDNTTRFLVIGRKSAAPSSDDKTTLMISASHTDAPGALFRLLEPFAKAGISLTRIESRPSRRKKWDYVFFVDLDGHAEQEPLASALAALKTKATLCKVVGSYPKAIL